jgi:hypothetical protein
MPPATAALAVSILLPFAFQSASDESRQSPSPERDRVGPSASSERAEQDLSGHPHQSLPPCIGELVEAGEDGSALSRWYAPNDADSVWIGDAATLALIEGVRTIQENGDGRALHDVSGGGLAISTPGGFSGSFGGSTTDTAALALDLSALGISTGEDLDGLCFQ